MVLPPCSEKKFMSKMTDYKCCFVDSNIWLYAFVQGADTDDKHQKSKALILANKETIAVSTQVVNEVCVNLLKKAVFDEYLIQDLIVSFYRDYQVIEVNYDTLLKASELRKRYGFSFWDSSIVASALQADASILFSEDMQDGLIVAEKLEIVNPLK